MLSSHHNHSVLTDEQALDVIISLACKGDREALREFFSQGYSVGHRVNGMTAVEKLAMDGDVDAVDFLLDYFCAGLNSAVRGYARSGNIRQVEALLGVGASIDAAVEGYAISQMDEQVDELISRGAKIASAAYGYAQVGAVEKLKKLADLFTEKTKSIDSNIELYLTHEEFEHSISFGLIKSRNSALLGALAEDAVHVDYALIMPCADAGMFDLVDAFIERSNDRARAIQCAVEGYALGCYQEQVEKLLQSGADITDAICGYAKSGLVKHAIELINKSDSNEAAYLYLIAGLERAGLVSKVDEYVQLCMRKFKSFSELIDSDHASDFPDYRFSYELGSMYSDDRIALRVLSFTNTIKLREILIKKLEDHANGQHQDVTKYRVIAAKAEEINRWMNEYDIGYSSALKLISLTESERVWCLQGGQMTRMRDENDVSSQPLPIIPYEMFLSITSKMLGLSIKNTESVVNALHENLMAESIIRNANNHSNGLFSRRRFTEENIKAATKFNPVQRFS